MDRINVLTPLDKRRKLNRWIYRLDLVYAGLKSRIGRMVSRSAAFGAAPGKPLQDIGYCQPFIDWPVYSVNSSGALVRMAQGIWPDEKFTTHYSNAVTWNMLRALWYFHQPDMAAGFQIDCFLQMFRPLSKKFQVFLDVEDIVFWTMQDNNGNEILDQYGNPQSIKIQVVPPSVEYHTLAMMQWDAAFMAETGKHIGIYTRADYWNQWVVPSNTEFWYGGTKYRTPDWSLLPLWIASWYNYVEGDPRLPRDWQTWTLHQYEGGSGRTPGILDAVGTPGSLGAADQNRFNGSYEQMVTYFGGTEVNDMSNTIYDGITPDQAARWEWISDEDKNVNVPALSTSTDFLMFGMVSQQVSGMFVRKDTAFGIRTDQSTVAVNGGVVIVTPDLFWKLEMDLDTFTNKNGLNKRTIWTNETVEAIVQQWRTVEIVHADWKPGLQISATDGKWHDIKFLVLYMGDINYTNPTGSKIGGSWQLAVVNDIVTPLITLMEGGYLPKIPILIAATTKWYQAYAGDEGWNPKSKVDAKQILGMILVRNWGEAGIDKVIVTDQAPMATPYNTLAEIWPNVPAATYALPFIHDWAKFKAFIFSLNRFRVIEEFYLSAPVTTLTTGVGYHSAADMKKEFGVTTVTPPPDNPPDNPPTTDPTLQGLQDQITAQSLRLQVLENFKAAASDLLAAQAQLIINLKNRVAELEQYSPAVTIVIPPKGGPG